MRRYIVFMLCMLACATYVRAQQKMTDEQVVEFVAEAREKGTSDKDIATQLLRKGVTMDQVNRIKRKYTQQQRTGQGVTLTENSRSRTAPVNDRRIALEDE